MSEENKLNSMKLGRKLTDLHEIIFHQVLFMIDDIQLYGEHNIDDRQFYSIDTRTVDRLICAVKGIEYRGPK